MRNAPAHRPERGIYSGQGPIEASNNVILVGPAGAGFMRTRAPASMSITRSGP